MNRIISATAAPVSVRVAVLSLILTLCWSVAAEAQQSPSVDEYGNQAASGEAAILAAGGVPGGNSGGSGIVGGQEGLFGSSGLLADASAQDPASGLVSSGQVGLTGVLPDTGGPLFTFVALGVFAVSLAGLLALRRSGRSQN